MSMTTNQTPSESEIAFSASVESLISPNGTVGFCGLTRSGEYPDAVTASGDRFDTSQCFKDAIQVLPVPGNGDLLAVNEFVADDAEATIDQEAIRNVDGLDVEQLEQAAGHDLDDITSTANASRHIPVADHKDIIDRRRLALRTLGFNCRFRWQIATTSYEAGDMQAFLERLVVAAQKEGADDPSPFGWIHYHDWGGEGRITTVFPDKQYTVEVDDEGSVLPGDGDALIDQFGTVGEDQAGQMTAADDGGEITVYYGSQIGYDYRGSSTIWARPVVYIPAVDTTMPVPGKDARFSRKHVGEFMSESHERSANRTPPTEWHSEILEELDSFATQLSSDLARARMLTLKFNTLPFSVTDFYEYLGFSGSIAEQAADRATALANPSGQPTLWNLQISLKIALLKAYGGERGSSRFQELAEVAGKLVRQPKQQLRVAIKAYQRDADSDDEEDDAEILPDSQQTLGDTLDDLEDFDDMEGFDLSDIAAGQAQQVQETVDRQIDAFVSEDDIEDAEASDGDDGDAETADSDADGGDDTDDVSREAGDTDAPTADMTTADD